VNVPEYPPTDDYLSDSDRRHMTSSGWSETGGATRAPRGADRPARGQASRGSGATRRVRGGGQGSPGRSGCRLPRPGSPTCPI
jgi:hypothetical protein